MKPEIKAHLCFARTGYPDFTYQRKNILQVFNNNSKDFPAPTPHR